MANHAEPHRPHYHLTPRQGWINDPNGLCFFRGEWHAFFQHYDPAEADSMIWGHATSRNLAHWKRLPTAIGPDEHGQIWSGSAVVDHHDTSGLFGGEPGMVCLFTYWDRSDARQCQGLAYSADGVTFHKHPENPVIPQLRFLPGHSDDKEFRDPKVFWHSETGRWIMAVAGGKLRIFSSPDLIHWQFESIDETLVTECPDLFPIPIDGDPARQTWVLSGGGRWYMLGNFDGRRFIPTSPRVPFTESVDFYAAQTFDSAPDGRRVMLSWLHAWKYGNKLSPQGITHNMPTDPWSGGCLTVPYELSLRSTPIGSRLMMQPVAELANIRQPILQLRDTPLVRGANPLAEIHEASLDIELDVAIQPNTRIAMRISAGGAAAEDRRPPGSGGLEGVAPATPESGVAAAESGSYYVLAYDALREVLQVDRRNSGMKNLPTFLELIETPLPMPRDGNLSLRILLDQNCVEIFVADGSAILPAIIFPNPHRPTFGLFADGGDCRVQRLAVFRMLPAFN
jgi:fructan beta-fructosidase